MLSDTIVYKKSFYYGFDTVEPKVLLVENICHLKEVEAKV
jgi:hypothetical protein